MNVRAVVWPSNTWFVPNFIMNLKIPSKQTPCMWEQKTLVRWFQPLSWMDEFRSLSLFLVGWILMHGNESRSFRWMFHGWVFPPLLVVRVLLTCALGKTTALRANATHEECEREERGPLVAAQNSRSGFSLRLRIQNRNRVVSILHCRFFIFLFF